MLKYVVSLLCVSAAILACGKNQSTSSVKSNEVILYKKSLQGSGEDSIQGRLYDALRRYATTTEGTRVTSLKIVGDDIANIEKVLLVADGESIVCQNTMYTMAPFSCDFALKSEELSWEKDKNSVQAVLFNAIASATNQRGAEYVGLNDSLGNSIVCYKQSYGYSCMLQLPSAVETRGGTVDPSTLDPNTPGENPSTGIPAFF